MIDPPPPPQKPRPHVSDLGMQPQVFSPDDPGRDSESFSSQKLEGKGPPINTLLQTPVFMAQFNITLLMRNYKIHESKVDSVYL